MARKRYDASLKDITDAHAGDLASLLGVTQIRHIRVLDAEVSTVTSAADKAMMIDSGGPEWVLHPEFVSGRDLEIP
jgi:hypothetical protein